MADETTVHGVAAILEELRGALAGLKWQRLEGPKEAPEGARFYQGDNETWRVTAVSFTVEKSGPRGSARFTGYDGAAFNNGRMLLIRMPRDLAQAACETAVAALGGAA
jgi:hypothetical protein